MASKRTRQTVGKATDLSVERFRLLCVRKAMQEWCENYSVEGSKINASVLLQKMINLQNNYERDMKEIWDSLWNPGEKQAEDVAQWMCERNKYENSLGSH